MEQEMVPAAARGGGPGVRRKAAPELDPLLRAALDCARSGLIILDRKRNVRLVTQAAAALLGVQYRLGQAGLPIMQLLAQSPWLDHAALQTLATAFGAPDVNEPRETLLSLPHPGGTRVVCLDLRAARGHGFVATLEDVTQSRETQDWLLEHASTDPVTGLCNRQRFMLMLRDRLESAPQAPTALLLLDLKKFKPINEALGTAVADTLLRLVGARLSGHMRDGDLVARLASDEFAIMATDLAGPAAIGQMSERLAEALARPFLIEGQLISIGAHIGAACAPRDGATPDILLDNAALALAAARTESCRAARLFEPRLDEQARARRALEADLRRALAAGEFELHYQPQIDVGTQRVTGLEALIRWRSQSRGMVPPNVFIPLAEEMGLIGEIGDWVLHTACREAMTWQDRVMVAVNASPLQVEAGDFAQRVARALSDSGLPGHRLEIEITENLLLRDDGTVLSTFAALRGMGVHLVLDDFGTGYASLSQLARFHFDKIKIDRSFIGVPDAAAEHSAIVRAIAALGISLGVPTTAEGVETLQQLRRVQDNGCTSVQGYFYSKPVPAGAVPEMLHRLNSMATQPSLAVSS